MKVTYTAPNRAHHYPYAVGLHEQKKLHAFISGFSRLSPRAHIPQIGSKLIRRDLAQTAYVLSLKCRVPFVLSDWLNRVSNSYLDSASYSFAKEAEIFLYYRTTGINTARRLKLEGAKVMCVMEEVNSHVLECDRIMKDEFNSLGLKAASREFIDTEARLRGYEEADYILCSSNWVKRSFKDRGFSDDKLLVNPYGFSNIKRVGETAALAKKPGKFRILYVGQLHYRKGLRYLVEAFRALRHPDKELVIVGPKTAVTGLENTIIPDGVIFAGELKSDALANEYESADVFCLPSLEEGLALVLGEALSYGLPIIATDQTGADDLFVDGEQGWIVPAGNSDSILNCLQKFVDQPDLLEGMSRSAMNRSRELGGWDASARNLYQVLEGAFLEWSR